MARTSVGAALYLSLLASTVLGCEKILGLEHAVLYQPDAGSTTSSVTGGAGGGTGGAAPSCTDSVKNGNETGKDCGGGMCPPCPIGEGCIVGTDCESHACNAVHVCVPPVCNDMAQNGDESDIDCGGTICPKCDIGFKCNKDEDCVNLACVAGVCTAECTPGEKQCVGNIPQTCDATWHWQSGACGMTTPQCCKGECAASVAEVAVGNNHTCARKTDGTLWCWGSGVAGQLGDGTTLDKLLPVQVTALGTDVAEVAAGGFQTCARKTDGTLWCWGDNAYGQLGDGTTVDRLSPVQVTALGTDVIQVAVATSHTCARKADSSLWCWGGNASGKLGDGTTVSKSSPTQVTSLGTTVADIAVGASYTCARKTEGSLWCWGNNSYGQLGDGTTASKSSPVQVTALGPEVAEVALGTSHTCARKNDGSLWCWGFNNAGQLGDGTVISKSSPAQIAPGIAGVAAGGFYTCATKSDGSLWCWGANGSGQLGDATTVDKPSPVQVSALGSDVAQLVAGNDHACVTKNGDGSLWCWGANGSGQVGDGTTDSPVTSPKLSISACE